MTANTRIAFEQPPPSRHSNSLPQRLLAPSQQTNRRMQKRRTVQESCCAPERQQPPRPTGRWLLLREAIRHYQQAARPGTASSRRVVETCSPLARHSALIAPETC
jgi:hypothetical protein